MDIKKILFRTNSIDVEKALPDAVIMCTKDGKIEWVNDVAAEIFETSKMHLLTSNISDFIETPMNLILNSVVSQAPVITKLVNREIYFDMTAKEISEGYVLDFRDSIATSLTTNIDNNENENINRDKNNFLLKLTNDLKSPIQSIVGFSQAMADGLGGELNEQQEKYIRIINKNSTDLMYFIAKMLQLSQTEVELTQIENKIFDIQSLVNTIVKYNEQLYKEKDLKFSIYTEEDLKKTIVADENLVKNIIQNILEVILKSVDLGEIHIELSNPLSEILFEKGLADGQYIQIAISSTSMLLSENELDFMFDPYKILDSSNRKNVLRAIVLASVKNWIQQLNGTIWLESQILKNTCFNVIIPSN